MENNKNVPATSGRDDNLVILEIKMKITWCCHGSSKPEPFCAEISPLVIFRCVLVTKCTWQRGFDWTERLLFGWKLNQTVIFIMDYRRCYSYLLSLSTRFKKAAGLYYADNSEQLWNLPGEAPKCGWFHPLVSFIVISLCGLVQKIKTQQCCWKTFTYSNSVYSRQETVGTDRYTGVVKNACMDATVHSDNCPAVHAAPLLSPNHALWICCVSNL